jgi:hypothetical protein
MSSPGRVTPRSKLARRIYYQGLSSFRNEVSDLQFNQPPRARSTPKAPSSADTPRDRTADGTRFSLWLTGARIGLAVATLGRAPVR